MKKCIQRICLSALLSCASFTCLSKSSSRVTVDTGTSGLVPGISVNAEPGESWNAFFSTVHLGTAEFLTSSSATATSGPLSFHFPDVKKDTYVEIAVSTNSLPGKSAFRWRTVVRPKGKALLDYRGSEELKEPDDFKDYWKRASKQLDAVKPNTVVTRAPDKDTSTGLLYRVELESVEKTKIVCWMYVPRDTYKSGNVRDGVEKSHPAIMVLPGYGSDAQPIDRTTLGYITLSVNPRDHGPSKAFWKSPVEHQLYNISKPDDYYYKLAALDCLQAARFIFSRDEVNKDAVGVEGAGQGGYLAVATAMLEPKIQCVATGVIGFTDYTDGMELAFRGGFARVRDYLASKGTTVSLVRKTLSYTDGANMIGHIKAPIRIAVGGLDPIFPYVCGIVAYNRIADGVKKEFRAYPGAAHEYTSAMKIANQAWLDRWLKSDEKKQDR